MDDNNGGSADAGANGTVMPGTSNTVGELRQELLALRQAFETHLATRLEQRQGDVREREAARVQIDKRLDAMNEFRAALGDQAGRFVERREYEATRTTINEQLARLRPEVGNRVDEISLLMAGMVTRREFDDTRTTLVERTEQFRANAESKLQTLTVINNEKLEQYRTARDLRTETDLAPIRAALAIQGRPNWGLIVSLAAVCFAIVSGVWLIIGLKIDNSVSPLTLEMAATKAISVQNAERLRFVETASNASTQLDGTSRTDRAQLNERVHQLEAVVPPIAAVNAEVQNLKSNYTLMTDRMSSIRSDQVKVRADLVEVETQFCAADAMRNQIHAYEMRYMAMVWHKLWPDTNLPTDNAYYARVGRCGPPNGT